jgi:autotransporter translocation and assembly factor TamB
VKRVTILIATGLLLLLIPVTTYIFRDRIIFPYLEQVIVGALASRLGLVVEIDEIKGTIFTNLELTGLRTIEAQPKSTVTDLALGRGRATYWLPDLLFGSDELLKNARITLDGALLEIDLDRRQPEETKREHPITIPSPESFPRGSISNSRFMLHGGGSQLQIEELDADLTPTGTGRLKRQSLRVKAELSIDHSRIRQQTGPVAALLHYSGKRLALEYLQFAGEPIISQANLDLTGQQQGVFALDSTLQLLGGKIELQGELKDTLLAGQIRTEPLVLQKLSDILAPDLPELAGNLAVTTEFQIDTSSPWQTLRGDLDLLFEKGSISRVPIDRIRLQAAAIPEEIVIRSLTGRISANSLNIEGVGIPAVAISERQWSRLLDASPGNFSLQFRDIPGLLAIAGKELTVRNQPVPLHHLSLQGKIGQRVLAIDKGLLETKSGLIDIGQTRLELAEAATWQEATIRSQMAIDVPQLAELGAILGFPSLNGAITGKIDLGGTIGAPSGQAEVKGQNLIIRGVGLGDWQLLAAADRKSVHLRNLTMQRAGDRLHGSGSFHLKPRTLEGMLLKFNVEEIGYYQDLLPLEKELTGRLNGHLTAAGPIEQPTLQLTATARNARVGELPLLNAEIEARSHKRTVEFSRAFLQNEHGSLSLTGELLRGPMDRSFEARLATLVLTTPEDGQMQLADPAVLTYNLEGFFTARKVNLTGDLGEIHMDGRLSRKPDSELKLHFAGLTSRYWLPLLMEDKFSFEGLDAMVVLEGTWRRPFIKTNGQVASLNIKDAPFSVHGSFDLDLTTRGFTIREFAWHGADDLAIFLNGDLPLNPWLENPFLPGPLSLSGLIEIPTMEPVWAFLPADVIIEGAMGGDISLSGTWNDPVGHLQLHGWGIRGRHPDFPAPFQPADLTADLLVQGDELQLNVMRISSPDLDFSASGRWTKGPALRNLLRGRDLRLAGILDLRGSSSIPDISWLGRGIEPIRRLRGALRTDLTLTGTAQDPMIKGTMQLSQGELRTDWNIPPIEALDLEAELGDHQIVLQKGRGQLGGAPFILSGSIHRDREQGPVFALKLQGTNTLLFRDEWTMVRADSNISLNGPWRQMALTGELAITDGFYRKNVAYLDLLRGSNKPKPVEGIQLFSFRQEPLRSMTFNVAIKPKNPFRIDNNLARGTLRPDLTLTGTGELPVLLGAIYVDEVRIRLPTTSLVVEAGLLQFTSARPNRPLIDLVAQTTMARYDIKIQVEGSLEEPVVVLSSDPPLPEDDLLLLLLAGRLPQNAVGVGETARSSGLNIAMYVGRGLLAKWFVGDDPHEESFLEKLEIELGREISRMGRETVEAQLAVAEDLFRKEDALFLTAERDVYDAFNVGIKVIFRFK